MAPGWKPQLWFPSVMTILRHMEDIKMKQRLLSAAIGLMVLFVVLFFYQTWVFNTAIALIAGLAVYELIHATGYVKSPLVLAASLVYGVSIPFYQEISSRSLFFYVTLAYLVFLLSLLLFLHQKIQFTEIAAAAFLSLVVPLAFAILIYMRDHSNAGLFYTMLACAAAWVNDSAAYFVGRKLGKHKLCPLISPNKTIEGAIGGVFFSILFFVLLCLGYVLYSGSQGTSLRFSYGAALLNGLVCAVVAIGGDLLTSVIKRQTGIKDFGKIMPGHGGIMDRFDSLILVIPALYLLLRAFPIFTAVG